MSRNSLIDVLEANRLLRSPDEVARFEQTLEKLAQTSDSSDLPSLHLVLDDACEQPEVMFSLVHFLESFEMQDQVQAFVQVLSDLVKRAAEWKAILHSRSMNDEIAKVKFEERVRSMAEQERLDAQPLTAFVVKNKISNQIATSALDSKLHKFIRHYSCGGTFTSAHIFPRGVFTQILSSDISSLERDIFEKPSRRIKAVPTSVRLLFSLS